VPAVTELGRAWATLAGHSAAFANVGAFFKYAVFRSSVKRHETLAVCVAPRAHVGRLVASSW
jgi:hypothetical protein